MTGLLSPVALFLPGTTHDYAIRQAGPSILSSRPPTLWWVLMVADGFHLGPHASYAGGRDRPILETAPIDVRLERALGSSAWGPDRP
jgi:hypothetical protein